MRNIFRVIDHIPPLWVVPLVSKDAQRLGDMVAGTVVVFDKPESISNLRLSLSQRPSVAATHRLRFCHAETGGNPELRSHQEDPGTLATTGDGPFLGQLVPPLAAHLKTDLPPDDQRLQFLHDLLAAGTRRQHRSLG